MQRLTIDYWQQLIDNLWRWQTVLPKILISVAHAPLGFSTIFQEDPIKLG